MPSQLLNKIDKKILRLAYPIILANISIPLLGLTDTAVIGHLGALDVLAGISIGAVLMGSIYWFFGFLRMGTVGIVSQAHGRGDYREIVKTLLRNFSSVKLSNFDLGVKSNSLKLVLFNFLLLIFQR